MVQTRLAPRRLDMRGLRGVLEGEPDGDGFASTRAARRFAVYGSVKEERKAAGLQASHDARRSGDESRRLGPLAAVLDERDRAALAEGLEVVRAERMGALAKDQNGDKRYSESADDATRAVHEKLLGWSSCCQPELDEGFR
jgi:hypothetical protein